jgi:hypothetical protein
MTMAQIIWLNIVDPLKKRKKRYILYISCSMNNSVIGMLTMHLERNIPNSYSCKGLGGSEMVVSWLFKFSDNDLDPHGSRAKVDKEDVATYY